MFSGGKFTGVSVWRADCRYVFFFPTQTHSDFKLLGQQCDEESVGQTGGQTRGQMLLYIYLQYFFPYISCQRQLQLLCYLCLVM